MHAYLIIAHNNWKQLSNLLTMLDNENSDIYIHIDKTAEISDRDIKNLLETVRFSHITFCERYNVSWGATSLIDVALTLLKDATKRKHDYYHLISGSDLPLRALSEIEMFFHENAGKEFVQFVPENYQEKFQKRVRYYWLFQEIIGNPRSYLGKNKMSWKTIILLLQRGFIAIQKIIKIDRRENNIKYYAGSEWFSITHAFAGYIVSKEKWLKRTFKNTLCSDEMFIQTLLMNSEFKYSLFCDEKNISSSAANQRLIDWGRGNPYVFKMEDLPLLKNCNLMFARKFDEKVDNRIILEMKKLPDEKNHSKEIFH